MNRLWIGLGLAILSSNVAAKISITYDKPESSHEQAAMADIKESRVNELVIELSNDLFPFKKPLTLHYGGEEGPSFDPNANTIDIPYEFYLESEQYFSDNEYLKKYGKAANVAATDTLLHTLLHEIGHAYVVDKRIPVLGKEEDAVDNFATLIMIEYIEDGGDKAIAAADMFAFESENEDLPDYYELGEYSDEHSFDLQRYFATLCLVYGSDPEKYQSLLDEVGKDYLEDRQDFCIENYEQLSDNWHQYLSKH